MFLKEKNFSRNQRAPHEVLTAKTTVNNIVTTCGLGFHMSRDQDFEIYSRTLPYLMIICSKMFLNQLSGVGWTYKMEQSGLAGQE